MSKHLVRATQEPGVVREVEDAELVDLHRSGILHSYEHTAEAEAVLGGTVKTPGKWKAPEKGAEIVTPPAGMTDPAANAGEGDEKKGA